MPRTSTLAIKEAPSIEERKKAINSDEDELLTISEVARRLRVDDTTCRRWIKSGALDAITLPHLGKRRGYRVKKSTLALLLNSGTISAR